MSLLDRKESLKLFQTTLNNYYERIKRNLPKQYTSFKDFVIKMQDLLKQENQPKLGKHLVVIRLTINMRNTKLKELALHVLLNLVSQGFIDGFQEDTTNEYYTEEFSDLFQNETNSKKPRKIIDTLVYSVTQCLVEKEEMTIQALKLLVAFVTNPWCEINSSNLVKIIRTIIYVYTCTLFTIYNIKEAKTPLMEKITKACLLQIVNLVFQAVEEEMYKVNKNKRKQSIKDDCAQKLTNLILLQMVDDIQLQRVERKQIINSDEVNEHKVKANIFGWCIMCRKGAQYICRENQVPICSIYCKKKYQEYIDLVQKTYDGACKQYDQSLDCALQLFDCLCRLLSNKTTLAIPKNQYIVLELIQYILDTSDFSLNKNAQFLKIVKDTLCTQLLKYCLETEKQLYQLSFKIFQRLVSIMRIGLKHEIAIFINQIYLTVLLSLNSQYQHKQTALDSLHNIFYREKTALEFYINYDCSMKHECLVERIVETLHQIVIGQVYTKPEYQINNQQELSLKILSTNLLVTLMENLSLTFDKYIYKPSLEEQPYNQTENDDESQYINIIEQQRLQKQELMKGCQLFNKNPKKGIQYLLNNHLISEDDIAKFLRETTQLTKDAVGQYLGGDQPINIRVLSDYTDLMKFSQTSVEQALRYFLDQFTLPSESQQVDRVVQKFSDKYFKDNPQTYFKSSVAIYTFTYLLVMLQTDLHNPNVADKMKLQDFVKLASKINDGSDLPLDMLQQIYSNIQKNPLAVHEKEKTNKFVSESLTQSIRKKQTLFQQEIESLLKQGKQLIKNQIDSNYVKISADSAYLIKPLIETIGQKMFDVFITMFNSDVSDQQTQAYVKALLNFIKLCSYFSVPLENYMNQLIKATQLNQVGNLNKRHFILIQQILQTVPQIGNGLRENGWVQVHQMISRLEELRLMQQQNSNDVQIIIVLPDFQLEFELIDKVLLSSKNLDDDAIQEFITALCQISKEEIFNNYPRIFSLQKLVEASDYNMDRVKVIWMKMWNVVRNHISEVAIKERKVAIFAVDSLKQLNIKFLQKEELYNFQFQREVLRPFETIFLSSDLEVKEFILNCINHLVLNHKQKIRSGWRVIFDLINHGLKEENDKISNVSYQILRRIISDNLDLIQDVHVDLIQALTALGRKDQEDMALASVDFVRVCLNYLSNLAQVQPKSNWDDANMQLDQEEEIKQQFTVLQLEKYWVPLLGMLSGLAGDKRASVQTSSMETLFQLLHQYGHAFSIEFWKIVFQSVLRPIFDEIQFTFQYSTNLKDSSPMSSDNNKSSTNWFKQSCKKGFTHITNLMSRYYPKLKSILPDFMKLFENCIQNQNEKLAKFSIQAVKNMVIKLGEVFTQDDWDQIINFLQRMLKITTPNRLLQSAEQSSPKIVRQSSSKMIMRSFTEESYSQCASQLLLIQITLSILEKFSANLSIEQLNILEQSCQNSYIFAKTFNSQIEQRFFMWRNGFMSDQKQLPGLLKQEREAYACMLAIKYNILLKVQQETINDNPSSQYYDIILQQYLNILMESIGSFNLKHDLYLTNEDQLSQDEDDQIQKVKIQEVERETQNSRTLLETCILPKIAQLTDEQLTVARDSLFDLLLDASKYSCDMSVIQHMCPECRNCRRCAGFGQSGVDQMIRQILKRLYQIK